MSTVLKILGFISGLIGSVMLVGTLGNVDMINEEPVGWIALVLVANVLPIGLGIFLYRRGVRMGNDRNYRKYEAMVLKLAQDNGGKITLADVTVHTSMTYKEAEEFLKDMYVHGVLDMDANAEGQIEYFLKS